MDPIQRRIAEWESVGLIDAATAERLRTAEASRTVEPEMGPPVTSGRPSGFAVSSVFGPGVTVGEMFAYLGVGFLLGAWTAFVERQVSDAADSLRGGAGMAIAAGALILLGLVLLRGDARRRRATGVAFLVAVAYVAAAVTAFVARAGLDGVVVAIVVAASALIAAAVLRQIHAALLTQVGLLGSVTGLGAALLAWVANLLYTPPDMMEFPPTEDPASPLPRLILNAAGWLVVALILGILALLEDPADDASEAADGDAARRRAALTRAWAGLVAVAGLSSAVTESHYINDNYGRVIPEWMAQLAILALAIVLVERAFRRDSGAFLLAAGIGFVIALTDFNFTYLTDSTEVGLLVEGGILLAVGFVADRLRRRLARDRSVESTSPAPTQPADSPHEL